MGWAAAAGRAVVGLTGDRPGSARVGSEGLAAAARNPRITPVLVPGAGHQVRRSDPQAFYRAVDTWLAEVLPVLNAAFGQWVPKRQRPELWNLYNGRHAPGEHVRVFPISNFTELDIWRYIAREQVLLPPIYYASEREVFERDGILLGSGCGTAPSAT